ncbi:hypothetical protein DQP56_15120 [Mycolicibacter senuensis]|nr:hypothetical protein DQP56_15120 [Mycolicibacter senuensis]
MPAGLRTLAQRCDILAGQVGVPLPPVTAAGWQTSGGAARAASAAANWVSGVLAGRMQATAAKLSDAARDYEKMDDGGAAALAAVGSGYPGGYPGGDGGAGGRGLPR